MTGRGPFLFLVGLLFAAGAGYATFRNSAYNFPFIPGAQETVWQVEARVEYTATGENTQVYLTLPPDQSGFRVVDENNASSGFGVAVETGTQRRVHWTKREANGEQVLFYKLELVNDDRYRIDSDDLPTSNVVIWDEPYDTAVKQALALVMPKTADGGSLADQLIRAMNTRPLDQNLSLLLDRYDRSDLLADMLATANIPARTVQVLELEDGRRRQSLQQYAQVYQDGAWMLFDPNEGLLTDTRNLLLWQTATPGVLEVVGGIQSRVNFSMIQQVRPALSLAKEATQESFRLSLYRLPIAEQSMFKLIMLLPVGALVVVFMRLVIGIRTSGTFMPILIALAFLQTELIPGVVSLLLVVAVGLVIRSYLSALNLLLVARIATLVILVIGIISIVSILSYELGMMAGLTITFFPMIILAWTIERMSIIWEEEGPREVLIQGGGSLLVAILSYLLMNQAYVQHWAFNFPELHLCVLAIILLLGRYTGYRVLELFRFSSFKGVAS